MGLERNLKTPGVYINEISFLPPSVSQVETAIPAFIGHTEKDDTAGLPTRIKSILEYKELFGEATPQEVVLKLTVDADDPVAIEFPVIDIDTGERKQPQLKSFLYYSVQHFFINGGGPCYIISVGRDTSDPELARLLAGLKKLESCDEPTLIVIPDAMKLSDEQGYTLMNEALNQCALLRDRFAIIDVKSVPPVTGVKEDSEAIVRSSVNFFRQMITGEREKTTYGAAYYPYLKSAFAYNFSDDTKIFLQNSTSNIPLSDIRPTQENLYNNIKAILNTLTITLPPSGAIAGVYADFDRSRGIWKAPANVQIKGITGPEFAITDRMQDDINVDIKEGKSVNAIRFFSGRGTLVWGARTLAGNDNEWRYISTRRLFIMVEESLKKSSASFVFEANDAKTWVKLRAMIENYLALLWRNGALTGIKPEQAFYVKIGLGQTMTAQDILEGRMNIEVGMAPVRPAEFIILRFMHRMKDPDE